MKLKKLTLVVYPRNSKSWSVQLTNGTDVGIFCDTEPESIFGITPTAGKRYKMRIRQTKTKNPTTTMVLLPPSIAGGTSLWRWEDSGNVWKNSINIFIEHATDKFLTLMFGTNKEVYLRIKLEEIV